ncbi:MAG TPA: sigma-70 family RNA polymerase sigma factor [Phycisphaerales bacterium]|nr:sigma-70 family RNA polymerase sigma factor [Phycisphaerales bacterium]
MDPLLSRALEGDQKALADVLTRDGVFARRALHDAIPAKYQSLLSLDDVMQQAYAEAVVALPRFEDRGQGSFAAWLTQLARCTLLDAVRMLDADKRGGGRVRVEVHSRENSCANLFDMLSQTFATPSRHAARHEAVNAVLAAIDQLPDAQRQVVEMYDLQGKPASEVAAALNRSEGAVYLLRVRAHRRLAETMGAPANYLTRQ